MEITFRTKKLQKLCNDSKAAAKEWSPQRQKLVRRRLDDLAAAGTLADMRNLPGRCHELRHEEDCLTLDLDGRWRLKFRVLDGTRKDDALDWSSVTGVEIDSIEDTHE